MTGLHLVSTNKEWSMGKRERERERREGGTKTETNKERSKQDSLKDGFIFGGIQNSEGNFYKASSRHLQN